MSASSIELFAQPGVRTSATAATGRWMSAAADGRCMSAAADGRWMSAAADGRR